MDIEKEIWNSIEGYEGLYQVSNLGNVRSLNFNRTGEIRVLKPYPDTCGYLRVSLNKEGKNKKFRIHRLVAMAFLDNPGNLPTVNHKNEIKSDNSVDNLEWCTRAYNNSYGTRTERTSKKVLQFTKNGEFVKEWKSTREAGRNGFDSGHVGKCCLGKQRFHKGFIWRYQD